MIRAVALEGSWPQMPFSVPPWLPCWLPFWRFSDLNPAFGSPIWLKQSSCESLVSMLLPFGALFSTKMGTSLCGVASLSCLGCRRGSCQGYPKLVMPFFFLVLNWALFRLSLLYGLQTFKKHFYCKKHMVLTTLRCIFILFRVHFWSTFWDPCAQGRRLGVLLGLSAALGATWAAMLAAILELFSTQVRLLAALFGSSKARVKLLGPRCCRLAPFSDPKGEQVCSGCFCLLRLGCQKCSCQGHLSHCYMSACERFYPKSKLAFVFDLVSQVGLCDSIGIHTWGCQWV